MGDWSAKLSVWHKFSITSEGGAEAHSQFILLQIPHMASVREGKKVNKDEEKSG